MIMTALAIKLGGEKKTQKIQTKPNQTQKIPKHHRHLVSFVKSFEIYSFLLYNILLNILPIKILFWVKWKLLFNRNQKFQHYISTKKNCIYLSIGPVTTINKQNSLTK